MISLLNERAAAAAAGAACSRINNTTVSRRARAFVMTTINIEAIFNGITYGQRRSSGHHAELGVVNYLHKSPMLTPEIDSLALKLRATRRKKVSHTLANSGLTRTASFDTPTPSLNKILYFVTSSKNTPFTKKLLFGFLGFNLSN